MKLLARAVELAGGESLALATVIRASGSTPRHPGAKMLIAADSNIFGTIGGGRIEQEVVQAGVAVVQSGEPRRVQHHLVRDLAMCCGGTMEVFVQPLSPVVESLRRAVELWRRREPAVLVTDLATGAIEAHELGDHVGATPKLDGDSFVEPVWPADRVILFGCGHVARAIGPLAASVGFEIVLCDDGETGAMDDEPDWADTLIDSFELADVSKELGPIGAGDYAVILTRDHAVDQRILERLLVLEDLSYLGMIGSRGKVGRFHKRLTAKGIATDERWQRLHAPVGIDIAAETPEEIAVSVVAQLIDSRNRRKQER